jgi:hypothetical protein
MIDVTLAAILALLLVSGLLLAFLSLMIGWKQIWWRVGLLLVIFLGIFSLGMLTPWRGLLLSFGGLLLVGIFMLLYARRPPAPEPEPEAVSPPVEIAPPPEDAAPPADETTPESAALHCPYCARELAEDYHFCPGCGHDTSQFRCCDNCGRQQLVLPESESMYCIGCGELLDKS